MAKDITIDGISIKLGKQFGAGGQGEVYLAHLPNNPNVQYVVKLQPNEAYAAPRNKVIVDANLGQLSPYIVGPFAGDHTKKYIRHISTFAPGVSIDQDLDRTLAESLEILHAMICQFLTLETLGIAHCDIGPDNVRVTPDGEVYIIDLDGATIPGTLAATPNVKGKHPIMAPEVRKGLAKPSINSDRFAIGVLASWILFRRHPAGTADMKPSEFERVMTNGSWPQRQFDDGTTVPIGALNAKLVGLFDRAFDLKPDYRPTMAQWRVAVFEALNKMLVHKCGQLFVHDPGRNRCPYCHHELTYPPDGNQMLTLRLPNQVKMKTQISAFEPIIIGRDNLPNVSQTISRQHLRLEMKDGLIFVKQTGRNPTTLVEGEFGFPLTKAVVTQPLTLQLPDGTTLSISSG